MLARIRQWLRRSRIGSLARSLESRLWPRSATPIVTKNTQYDQETIEVMSRCLGRNSCCLDLGAHEGRMLREMLNLAPDGHHWAFEPLPHLAKTLRTAFPKVTVIAAAASDHSGSSDFIFVRNAPAYSGVRRRIYDRPDPDLRTIRVPLVTIDDTIPDSVDVSFVKVDIEGGEFDALRGATLTIRRCRPIIVFEAGAKSTGQYGVNSKQMYELVTQTLECRLSTMHRWLEHQDALTEQEFSEHWASDSEYYFIAYPGAPTQR